MSYDVSYEVKLGGEYVEASLGRNYTSNCAPMWRAAGCDIAEWDGRPVTQFACALRAAIADMQRRPDFYAKMNPPNGWGDAEGCLENFLKPLLRDAQLVNQDAVVRVSR